MRPPPRDATCDACVDVLYDDATLLVVRCRRSAVETCIDRLGNEAWLCKPCADHLEQRGRVTRRQGDTPR